MRRALASAGRKRGVETIDLMGPLIRRLSEVSGLKPAGKPGLYRSLRKEYFERVEAIDFAVAHDDGQRLRDLERADVVVVGVSRSGKTPICMYLAVQGLKAANVPIVKGLPLPEELYRLGRRRVVGLAIGYDRLMSHRRKRQEGMGRASAYSRPEEVFEELEAARDVMSKAGFYTVSVTDRPIESIAEEIIGYVTGGE